MNVPMTFSELQEILRLHAAWLRGESDGKRANLTRANLNGANLYGANLNEATLYGANLNEATLYGANLTRANLYGATLYGANLTRANLYGATLNGANLYGANLTQASLQGVVPGGNKHLFIAGENIRGWIFYGWCNLEGVLVVKAGCREFIGIAAARDHWTARHTEDGGLHDDCLRLVDCVEHMARVRGWNLEPEAKSETVPVAVGR